MEWLHKLFNVAPFMCVMNYLVSWVKFRCLLLARLTFGQARLPQLSDLEVLYKSDNYVVINKQPDIKINSNDPADKITVATQLEHTFPTLVDSSVFHGFRFMHRLDYATSGALCIALNKLASKFGSRAFINKRVTKHYIALLRGHVAQGEKIQTIDVAIGKDTSVTDISKMCTVDSPYCDKPRDSQTTLVLLEHGTYRSEPASKVLLIPQTGRTHQLRVHCDYIGHRIIGDYMYSNRQDFLPYRMMLHAMKLHIPMTKEIINITTPDPFITEIDAKWKVTRVFATYRDICDTFDYLYNEHPDLKKASGSAGR